jgi:soluble P-type ATPase
VEGYELPVIGGMQAKIDLISFEYHLNKDDCAAKLQIIENLKPRLAIIGEGATDWTIPWASLNDLAWVISSASFYSDG